MHSFSRPAPRKTGTSRLCAFTEDHWDYFRITVGPGSIDDLKSKHEGCVKENVRFTADPSLAERHRQSSKRGLGRTRRMPRTCAALTGSTGATLRANEMARMQRTA